MTPSRTREAFYRQTEIEQVRFDGLEDAAVVFANAVWTGRPLTAESNGYLLIDVPRWLQERTI
jgi:hypothetical protein